MPLISDSSPGTEALDRTQQLRATELLLIASSFFACVELRIAGAFTVYDVMLIMVLIGILVTDSPLRFVPAEFALPLFVFFLFACISTFRSPEPLESATQILQFAFIFFVQITVLLSVVRYTKVLRCSVMALCFGALVVVGISYHLQVVQGSGRVLTFFSEGESRLAYPTAYLLPFGLYYVVNRFRRRAILVPLLTGLPCAALAAWSLSASGSRSAFLAAAVSLGLFITLRDGFAPGLPRVFVRGLATIVLVSLAGFSLWSTDFFPHTLSDRVERTLAMDDNLVVDRTSLAKAGWLAFLESPIVGVGLDNFRHVAQSYNPETTPQLPHNLWLQFLTAVGLPGTIAIAWIFLAWYLCLGKAWQGRNDADRVMGVAFLVALTAILTIFMFVPIMIQRQYWLIFGLGLAWARLDGAAMEPHSWHHLAGPRGVARSMGRTA